MAKKKKAGSSKSKQSMAARGREMLESRESGGSGGGTKFNFPEGTEVKWFKLSKKKHLLDIIPYTVTDGDYEGSLWWEKTIHVHANIGTDDSQYLCPKEMEGKKCPICEARAELAKTHGWKDDLVKALKPKHRQIFNVIDCDDPDREMQFWEVAYFKIFGELLADELDDDPDMLTFALPEDGFSLQLRCKGKTFNKNPYFEVDKITFVERDDLEEEELDEALNLDEIPNVLSYAALDKIFLDKADEEEEEEDDERPARKKKPSKRKTAKEEEPDDEDDDGEEEEEEETPKRRKKKASSKRKKKADPEEEDEQEEEEEEEEKPKRKKKSSSKRKKKPEPEPEEEDDDDEEEEEEPPKRKKKTSSKKSSSKRKKQEEEEEEDDDEGDEDGEDGVCPEDGTFGTDCNELDECFDCKQWDDCQAAQAAAKKKKPKSKRKK